MLVTCCGDGGYFCNHAVCAKSLAQHRNHLLHSAIHAIVANRIIDGLEPQPVSEALFVFAQRRSTVLIEEADRAQVRSTMLPDKYLDLTGSAVSRDHDSDVTLDARQMLQLAHTEALRREALEGVDGDLREDDVLGTDLVLLEKAWVQLADPADRRAGANPRAGNDRGGGAGVLDTLTCRDRRVHETTPDQPRGELLQQALGSGHVNM
jgi:hypothetical protein